MAIGGTIRQVTFRLIGDRKDAQAAFNWANAEADKLQRRTPTVDIKANVDDVTRKLALLRGMLDALKQQHASMKIDVGDSASLAKLAALKTNLNGLENAYTKLAGASKVNTDNLDRFEAGVQRSRASFDALALSVANYGNKIDDAAGGYKRFTALTSTGLGIMGAQVKLWGGLATHGASVFSIALHGLLETTIAVTGALIALTGGVVGLAGAAIDVTHHMQAVQMASDGLGTHIRPLTSNLSNLQHSLAPQGLQIFGGAMLIAGRNSGAFAQMAHMVSNIFVGWMANIDLWSRRQSTMNHLIMSSVGFLQQFGHIFGQLLLAFDGLMKIDPGVSHVLGDVVGGAATLLHLFTELPGGIAKTILQIHAVYLWGGLAVTMLRRFANMGPFGGVEAGLVKIADKFGLINREAKTFAGLKAPQWIAVGAVVGFMIDAGIQAQKATPQIQHFVAALNERINNEQASTAIIDISNAVGSLQTKMSTFNIAQVMQNWNKIGPMGQQWAQSFGDDAHAAGAAALQFGKDITHIIPGQQGFDPLKTLQDGFTAVKDAIVPGAGAIYAFQRSMNLMRNSEAQFNKEQGNLVREAANLSRGTIVSSEAFGTFARHAANTADAVHQVSKNGMSFATALGIMDQAGVRASDSYQLMQEKVAMLLQGYKDMGAQQGILKNAVNAATFGIDFQANKVNQLIQGYQQFLQVVTGSSNAFVGFAQDMLSVNKAIDQTGGTGRMVTKTYAATAAAAGGAARSVSSLTTAQASVKSAQASLITSQGVLNRLQNSGTATSSQLRAEQLRVSAAQGRLTAAQQRLAQVQQAGTRTTAAQTAAQNKAQTSTTGLNASSLQLRNTWNSALTQAGQVVTTLLSQSAAAGMGTRGYHLLTQAGKDLVAQLLAGARGSKQNTAQLYALAQEAGYHGADSFKALSKWVQGAHTSMSNLDRITTIFTAHSSDLQTDVNNLAEAINHNLNQAMAQAIFLTTGGDKWINKFAEAVHGAHGNIDAMIPSAQKLASQLIQNTHNATEAHKEFDTFSMGLGLTRKQADQLWNSLKRVGAEHPHPTVTETGSGKWTIANSSGGEGPGGKGIGSHIFQAPGGASGRYINVGTGPRADDVLLRVSRGELVVPANMVSAGLVDHLRGAIPGFASGGLVPNYQGKLPGMTPWTVGNLNAMTNMMTSAMISAMQAQQKQNAAAFSSLRGIPGGSGVARWASMVRYALVKEGLSAALTGNVLYQMQTESSGNPRAINLTDSNAAAGDPSRGLMQTIMSTFRAYHWPGTSWNIYDPLANIMAAINYARHVYGPTLMRGGMGIGSGHGYAGGTPAARPGWAWVGEGGLPELVNFHGGEQVLDGHSSRLFAASRGYASGTGSRFGMNNISAGAGRQYAVVREGDTINIYVQGDTNPHAAAQRIWKELRELKRLKKQPLGLD